MNQAADQQIVMFYVREGRDRAIPLAKSEVLSVFGPFSPTPMDGGPMTGQKKVFCVQFPEGTAERGDFIAHCERLGYTEKVSLAEEVGRQDKRKRGKASKEDVVWKGRVFVEQVLYEEDKELMRQKDPDQRTFLLQKEGRVEPIKGYRGHGENFGRRALPVSDCRLLVNLSMPENEMNVSGQVLLDPFAGAGGIVIAAKELGITTYSLDVDADLKPGLSALSTKHFTTSATDMHAIKPESVDAIATEAPFEERATANVAASFREMQRVLKPSGKIAIMTAPHQVEAVEKSALQNGFTVSARQAVDRKGTEVEVLVFQKKSDRKLTPP